MMKQPVQKIEFKPAVLSERLIARAVIEQSSSSAAYESRWNDEGTRFPLQSWTLGGKRMLAEPRREMLDAAVAVREAEAGSDQRQCAVRPAPRAWTGRVRWSLWTSRQWPAALRLSWFRT